MRRDRRRHREDRELLAAEDLVPTARDRLLGRGDDAQHDVAQPVDPRPRGSREVEGARSVVQERRVVVAQGERDRGVRLVPRGADRVEAPPVLLEPARRVVGLPAVDLRAPDVLHLGRRRAERRARLELSESSEKVLFERVGLGGHEEGRKRDES